MKARQKKTDTAQPCIPSPSLPEDETRAKYRDFLVAADREVIGLYGKTIVTLSGGALGVSMTVLKEFFSKRQAAGIEFVEAAWACWAFSLFSVLFSYYSSHLALRLAIANFDSGIDPQKTFWNSLTKVLNPLGAVLFLSGLLCFIRFLASNPF